MREHLHRDSVLPEVMSLQDGCLPSGETAWMANDLSMRAEGVLDSGATKTAIGSQLVGDLLKALHPDVKNKVFCSHCGATFRFGNLNTLEARHALVIPIGPVNLHVAIVPGSTPFMISNTLMRALKAIVNTHSQELHSPCFRHPIPLRLSPRGLFLLDVNELVQASVDLPRSSQCQDTFVAEDGKCLLPKPSSSQASIELNSDHRTTDKTEPIDKGIGDVTFNQTNGKITIDTEPTIEKSHSDI